MEKKGMKKEREKKRKEKEKEKKTENSGKMKEERVPDFFQE